MARCLWHGCNREFQPTRAGQRFCSPVCQIERATWKQRRGAPLVDLLLSNDANGLDEARERISAEVEKARQEHGA
jgi:hypothetical protein